MIETYEMSIGLHLLFVKVLLGLLVLHLGLVFIGDTAKFSFSDGASPSVIDDTSDASAIYVLMPMRV